MRTGSHEETHTLDKKIWSLPRQAGCVTRLIYCTVAQRCKCAIIVTRPTLVKIINCVNVEHSYGFYPQSAPMQNPLHAYHHSIPTSVNPNKRPWAVIIQHPLHGINSHLQLGYAGAPQSLTTPWQSSQTAEQDGGGKRVLTCKLLHGRMYTYIWWNWLF